MALIYLELGQQDEARAEFEKLAADDFAAMPRDGRWLYCIVYLSEVCAALGDAARGAVLYRLLMAYAGRNIILGAGIACCGSADRYLGLLSATMGHWREAQQHFERALAMNTGIGARVALAYTQHDSAAMLLAHSAPVDRERAMTLLKASLESARGIGMRALEERAARRLDELTRAGAGLPDELTGREAEVLRLIAIGRSNADIATVLSISLNTVATHVRNFSPRPAAPTAPGPPPTPCAAAWRPTSPHSHTGNVQTGERLTRTYHESIIQGHSPREPR